MKTPKLKLAALALAATLSASAQRVDQIPVTQAGLVPTGGFSSATAVHYGTSDAKGAQVLPLTGPALLVAQPPAATPDFSRDESSLETDQNLVPRRPPQILSKYVVRDGNAPQFRLRDTYTKRGLGHLELHDHPGLHVGNFRHRNEEAGYGMFLEEEHKDNVDDFTDTALAMEAGGDPAEAGAILDATDKAFHRDEYSPNPINSILDAPQPKSGTLLMNLEQLRLTLIERQF